MRRACSHRCASSASPSRTISAPATYLKLQGSAYTPGRLQVRRVRARRPDLSASPRPDRCGMRPDRGGSLESSGRVDAAPGRRDQSRGAHGDRLLGARCEPQHGACRCLAGGQPRCASATPSGCGTPGPRSSRSRAATTSTSPTPTIARAAWRQRTATTTPSGEPQETLRSGESFPTECQHQARRVSLRRRGNDRRVMRPRLTHLCHEGAMEYGAGRRAKGSRADNRVACISSTRPCSIRPRAAALSVICRPSMRGSRRIPPGNTPSSSPAATSTSSAAGLCTLAGYPVPGTFNYRLPLNPRRWVRVLDELEPGLIEAGDAFHPAWCAWRVARRRGIALAAFYHSNLPQIIGRVFGRSCAEPAMRRYVRWLYERFDVVFAPSRLMCAYLQGPRRGARGAPATRRGHCGVHPGAPRPAAARAARSAQGCAGVALRGALRPGKEPAGAAAGVRAPGAPLPSAADRRRARGAPGGQRHHAALPPRQRGAGRLASPRRMRWCTRAPRRPSGS